jgi:JAB-like toxin  1
LDLNWYDLGARNYDQALGRFMNVDPLAENYLYQSPYAFAANNPVFFIDINGLGVDDTFIIDDKRKIVKKDDKKYYDENGKEIDRLYKVDSDGNTEDTNGDEEVNEDDSVAVDKGVLDSKETKTVTASDGKDYTFDMFKVTGDDKAKNLFEFVSDNTKVEWSWTGTGAKNGSQGQNFLTTSHEKSSEIGGGYLLAYRYTIRFSNHSHPYGNNAGLYDKSFARSVNTYFPKARTFIYHKKNYFRYNQNGTTKPVRAVPSSLNKIKRTQL